MIATKDATASSAERRLRSARQPEHLPPPARGARSPRRQDCGPERRAPGVNAPDPTLPQIGEAKHEFDLDRFFSTPLLLAALSQRARRLPRRPDGCVTP
ncbi:hypothetical protein MRX96_018544 [Rhipicephalus microplus]